MSSLDRQKGIEPLDVLNLCKKYLGRRWDAVNETNFEFKVLTQGFGNRLFICGVQDGHGLHDVEPAKVLVRFYGGNFLPRDAPMRTLTPAGEVLVFYALGQAGLGPGLYGAFDGGRIEQFLQARTLTLEEFCEDDAVNRVLAKCLARFHAQEIPIQRSPWDIVGLARGCMAKFEAMKDKVRWHEMLSFDIHAEIDWLEKTLPKMKTRIVFSHNDCNRSNVLVKLDNEKNLNWDEKLMLIDYEFCGYNFRGADIGNHFTMKVFDFGSEKFLSGRTYPDEATRREFVRAYLYEAKKQARFAEDWDEDGLDSEENVMIETEFFCCATRILGQAWCLSNIELFAPQLLKTREPQPDDQNPDAGFVAFYKTRKAALIEKYPQFS